jgi:hypothetical protein
MPKNANASTSPSRKRKHANQPGSQPALAESSCDSVAEPMERAIERITAKPAPYSHPPRKPPPGLSSRAMSV